MVNTGFIGSYITVHAFVQWWHNHTIWYIWYGYSCMLPYTYLLSNNTHVIYGGYRIDMYGWYHMHICLCARLFPMHIVCCDHAQLILVTMWLRYQIFNICVERVISDDASNIIPLNKFEVIVYSIYPRFWCMKVSELLIYPDEIFMDIIHTLVQVLLPFNNSGTYREQAACLNILGCEFSYVRYSIRYIKIVFYD